MSEAAILPSKKIRDIRGIRFGRLTVVGFSHRCEKASAWWDCQCDCGGTKTVRSGNLRSGNTTSCGCADIERANRTLVKAREAHFKHGMSKSPEHRVWRKLKQRCGNPKDKSFPDYGGRGIAVCDRWRDSFENFYADMGPRPKGMTLDRIDNNGPYSPDNCRWATKSEQASNRRTSRIITFAGVSKTLKGWCEFKEMNYRMVSSRVYRGMDPVDALELL